MSYNFTPGVDRSEPAALSRITSYDVDILEKTIRKQLDSLGLTDMFKGKRVVVKPNLVMKKSPDAAATTHPAVLEAMLRILKESAADILIAESPPGLYTESALKGFYNSCGITEVASRLGVKLNFDTSSREAALVDAKTAHGFELISPILDAEVIVNLAKLKSHALTKLSGTVKNYYGVIPGIQKVETHARFPDYSDFGSMLVDLCAYNVGSKPTFNLLDGIVGMEGNGPTGGTPKAVGCLISGRNPFSVDTIAAHIIGLDGVIMLDEAKARGFTADVDNINITSDEPLDSFVIKDFKLPDSVDKKGAHTSSIVLLSKLCGGRVYKWIQPRPVVDKQNCIGCGECYRSCPQKTIELMPIKGGNKKRAIIHDDNCIKCYCCQELCPIKAIKIKKNPLFKLIGG
ncbi:MAG: DUF362 domain-containing protein [Clostridiales bacterium]|nr:DUF362 domain-containing protein [Clostridiales bacterium]